MSCMAGSAFRGPYRPTCSRQSRVPWYALVPPRWFIMRVRTTSTGFEVKAPAKPHTKLDLGAAERGKPGLSQGNYPAPLFFSAPQRVFQQRRWRQCIDLVCSVFPVSLAIFICMSHLNQVNEATVEPLLGIQRVINSSITTR